MPDRPTIAELAAAVYGKDWQSAFARARGLNIRTVQRYATGEVTPREAVYAAALADVERHASHLTDLIRRAKGGGMKRHA